MNLHVMAVYDKKGRCYAQPFFSAHPDVGLRSFAAAVNTPSSAPSHNPEDFSLFLLGTFNDDTGRFNLTENPVVVAEAINLKRVPNV